MQSQQNSSSKKGMIFFLRHGERADCVDFDELSKIEISVDPHLTELGKLQARYSAYELRKMTEDHIKENTKYFIISSPFLRCIQTASEIALALGKENIIGNKVYLENFLSEFLNHLYFESSPLHLLHSATRFQDLIKYTKFELQNGLEEGKHFIELKYPETAGDLFNRTSKGYEKVLEAYEEIWNKEGNTVLILVTHGYGVQSLLDYYDVFDLEKGIEYTSLSQVFYDFETKKGTPGNIQWHKQLEKAEKEFEERKKKQTLTENKE